MKYKVSKILIKGLRVAKKLLSTGYYKHIVEISSLFKKLENLQNDLAEVKNILASNNKL